MSPSAPRARTGSRRRPPKGPRQTRGRLKPHDPFELIRWLALSQPDPRKALAELVQNSLDAGARRIRVTRRRERGRPCLRIWDDGDGVLPDLDRVEALRYIATHIGHSRKRSLTPQERLTLMTQGQYGIGLLGFWSLGQTLELRTSLPGYRPHRLILHRDRPSFLIEPLHGRLPVDGRWTEVVITDVHAEALPVLTGRRAADYLAAELRGQLLGRNVDLVVEDRMSRGRAQKLVPVRPPRFLGRRLEGLTLVEVPGHPPVRLEIYLGGEVEVEAETSHGIAVCAAGTKVADGFHELAALDLDHEPWTDLRLRGLVDFPALQVAPGSRRGILADAAAMAFARALRAVEPVLTGTLDTLEEIRARELDRTIIRDLQRAFRDFYRHRPRYALLPVQLERTAGDDPASGPQAAPEGVAAGPGGAAAETAAGAGPDAATDEAAAPEDAPAAASALLPAGPLSQVRVRPAALRVECGVARTLRATGLDAVGRPVDGPVVFTWLTDGPIGLLATPDPFASERAEFTAAASPAAGAILVRGRCRGDEAKTRVAVEVLEEIRSGRSDEGIPEPKLVHHPGAAWRSRMQDGIWEVNAAHREYELAAERPGLKLRYLALLFAKEVVLRSAQDPRLERPLEQLVEVAAYADRNLAGGRRGRRKSRPPGGQSP